MSPTRPERYIIGGGREGADRLKVLACATWPTSEAFLRLAGLRPGMRCLDVGCGSGEMAFRMLDSFGVSEVVGLDCDAEAVQVARAVAAESGANARFSVVNIERDAIAERPDYDFVYARLLLSHLRDPGECVRRLLAGLVPGGILAVEDVDFRGHFCHPPCPAFDRYVRWYEAASRLRGADPWIGPRLPGLLIDSGLNQVRMSVALPTFLEGDGKLMGLLTLESIRHAVLQLRLATEAHFDRTVAELREFTSDPRSMMSLPRLVQAWGTLG